MVLERTLRIQYRASPKEVKSLQRLAETRGLSMADMLRQLVRDAVKTQKENRDGQGNVSSTEGR